MGMDVVTIVEVADSLAVFGDRYVGRLFTEHEVASCRGSDASVAAGLAARFAAKEAAIKVLRPSTHQPEWRSIEVRRHPDGWCALHLSDSAARLARQQGISDMAVSLTHDRAIAAAVVVALVDGERSGKERGAHGGAGRATSEETL